jgi:predicted ATP-dependent protease
VTMITLGAEQLRAIVPSGELPSSTREIEPLAEITGQGRALEAISFGLSLGAEGYNIIVSGPVSSGRNTAAEQLVAAAAAGRTPSADWFYLYNFADPFRPKAASLPAGLGGALQRDMTRLVEACRNEVPRAFESESYQERSVKALEPVSRERDRLLEELQRVATHQGFTVNITPMGFAAIPVGQDGRPLAPEVIGSLPEDIRAAIDQKGETVQAAINTTVRDLRRLDTVARQAIEALDRDVLAFVVGHLLAELRAAYAAHDGMGAHLDSIEADIAANLEQYKRFTEAVLRETPAQLVAQAMEEREQLLKRYGVNLFVLREDGAATGAPVVHERHPTYFNLFGRIDYEARFGALTTDFTRIRPGSMHRANGGFLIVQLEDLLSDGRSWLMLKRALKTHEVRVEGIGDLVMPFPAVNLVPEAIPLDVKVVLVGQPQTVGLLGALDPDFAELFKVRAEFEPDAPAEKATVRSYAAFVRKMADASGLVPFDRVALIEVVHYGNRLAARQDRITSRYGAISDLCQEASQLARLDGSDEVTGQHVLLAIEGKRRRSSMLPDRLRRMITEGTLHVETTGKAVGQVNGLAVYDVGNFAFGTPMRISCRTGLGRRGVVAIEREVERSGAIHSKGVLVLSGYLVGAFGRERPLTFTASLTFEQSYDEVEGDSASSAELYAILASLADVPVRQDIAVTGSVDQFGRVQAVGGVTEKVEGFFDVCAALGLNGSQGVAIPKTNMVNLTLRPDVISAVAEHRFNVWAIERIEEGLELLTGVQAGERQADGSYPEGTIFRMVVDSLEAMHGLAVAADGPGVQAQPPAAS